MRADVLGFRKVEAEEGCVVTVLAESDQLGLLQRMREYERSPWWLRLFCPRSYLVRGFAINLFLEGPFPLQCEEARKDGVAIEGQKWRRLIGIQAHGRAWWEASLLLSEAFSRPSQGMAGFSTLEAVFSGGEEKGQTAFRILYRIDMRELQCEVGVWYRGAQLIRAVLSEENAQWGWDLRLGRVDGVKVAAAAKAPSEEIPSAEIIIAADVGGPTSGIAGGGLQAMGR
jgi:hypothetical protein